MVRSIGSVLAAGLLLAATAGTTYAAVPTNDAVETPETISGTPYTNTQDTTEATSNATDPECFDPSPTVWYAYTPADTGWFAADTFGSDYDTTLAVLGPDGNGGYEIIDCNDDTDTSVQSRVRLEAQGGVMYLFMVGAFGGFECCPEHIHGDRIGPALARRIRKPRARNALDLVAHGETGLG